MPAKRLAPWMVFEMDVAPGANSSGSPAGRPHGSVR